MQHTDDIDHGIDLHKVKLIAKTWPRRASVRTHNYEPAEEEIYDQTVPDYPTEMLPFREHPAFLKAGPQQVERVLTLAWLTYNQRTITAEERIANPAFQMIKDGVFPGVDHRAMQKAIIQSTLDENFHTLMHLTAMDRTCELRSINEMPRFPHAVTYEGMRKTIQIQDDEWARKLTVLVYAIVAEISINAYLDLIAKNDSIQPMHSKIATMHNQDEYMHSSLLVEIAQCVFSKLNAKQRRTFVQLLPNALRDFSAHDFSAWKHILQLSGIDQCDQIIRDAEEEARGTGLVRDYSGLKRLVDRLEIADELEFDFSGRLH